MTMSLELIRALGELAEKAGRATMEVRARGFRVTDKADKSPVTEADLRAHEILVEGISHLTPEIPIISEEGGLASLEERQGWPRWYLVDPLDGTREYASGGSDFTVNIALLEEGVSQLGVVHVPTTGETFVGAGSEGIAYVRVADGVERDLGVTDRSDSNRLRVVASKSHRTPALASYLQGLEDKYGEIEAVAFGSSLKFCALADGRADLYPRLGPTSQWDTAAGQAVLEASGGIVWAPDGSRFSYEPRETFLNTDFLACADASKNADEFLWGSG